MSADAARRYAPAIAAHAALIVAWYLFVKSGNVPNFVMPSPIETVATLGGPELSLVGNIARHRHRDFRRLFPGRRGRSRARPRLHLVEHARSDLHAAAGQPQHDPEGGARAADHRLVHYGMCPNTIMAFSICFFPILLTTARGLREVEPELLDLVRSLRGSRWQTVHQDPAAERAALHLLRHEGGARSSRSPAPIVGEFLGSDQGPRLPDAAGAGDARYRGDVHGGDPDHAASACVLYGLVLGLERLLVVRDARIR